MNIPLLSEIATHVVSGLLKSDENNQAIQAVGEVLGLVAGVGMAIVSGHPVVGLGIHIAEKFLERAWDSYLEKEHTQRAETDLGSSLSASCSRHP